MMGAVGQSTSGHLPKNLHGAQSATYKESVVANPSQGYPQIILSGTDRDLPEMFQEGYLRYTDERLLFNGRKAYLEAVFDNIVGRMVARKTLRYELRNDEEERRRFLREARVTAQLAHPNTIPVYEIGTTKGDSIFFTMKLLRGEDLYEAIKRLANRDQSAVQAYPMSELVEIFLQVSQALAFAHAHGVIHRDIKPENVWLGQFGEVVLLDWGVAKVWGVEDPPWEPEDFKPHPDSKTNDKEQLRTLTRSGQLPGTPLYMSPEQILGHKGIDERSDVFSMGVMLYELMTLKEPFRGETVRKTFDLIIHDDPISPRERAPERHISEAFEAIILRAIEKEKKDRYQSVQEMMADVRDARDALL
ncbi:Serine/threonine-protein kinase PknD [Thalassoglobus neptunius]|uniref:Serine/threonine-protein kinase PknD n=2 Tax=Thalassoglobus neptunius TaxID=1938619 RepID=A0A5C5WZS3_9PLAN|nr:Serine/threonine-protein kinase PknD [Thalassoglobus neptunius]